MCRHDDDAPPSGPGSSSQDVRFRCCRAVRTLVTGLVIAGAVAVAAPGLAVLVPAALVGLP